MAHGTTLGDLPLNTGQLVDQREGMIVLALAGTDYQLHLAVAQPPQPDATGTLRGRIVAQARRVDLIQAGGVFFEPVIGRPRRIQGKVVAADASANTITVRAVAVFTCKLDARQQAGQFPVGALVAFDVERGAVFEPA